MSAGDRWADQAAVDARIRADNPAWTWREVEQRRFDRRRPLWLDDPTTELLARAGVDGLPELAAMTVEQLRSIPGIGPTRAARVAHAARRGPIERPISETQRREQIAVELRGERSRRTAERLTALAVRHEEAARECLRIADGLQSDPESLQAQRLTAVAGSLLGGLSDAEGGKG